MDKNDLMLQAEGVIKLLDELVEHITKARREEAEARIEVEKVGLQFAVVSDRLTRTHHAKAAAFLRQPVVQQELAAYGNSEKVMDMMIDSTLQNDADFAAVLGEFYRAQETVDDAEAKLHLVSAKVTSFADALAATRSKGAVVAAVAGMLS